MSARERLPPGQAQVLREVYRDLLLLAGRMRDGECPMDQAADLHAWAERQLREARRRLLGAGLDEAQVEDSQLPVVGLLDEAARLFGERWPKLQYTLRGKAELGVVVFERLEALLTDPRTPIELLELYHLCLAWGFQGRYAAEQRLPELRIVARRLETEIHQTTGQRLALVSHFGADPVISPPPPRLLSWQIAALALLVLVVASLGIAVDLRWEGARTASLLRPTTGEGSGR
jgi:type VI secretion system protein ImpK